MPEDGNRSSFQDTVFLYREPSQRDWNIIKSIQKTDSLLLMQLTAFLIRSTTSSNPCNVNFLYYCIFWPFYV